MLSIERTCEWMSPRNVKPKMSSTVLTFVPACCGSSLFFSHAMLWGPSLPDSLTTCRGGGRGAPAACRRRARDG
eukprot:7357776-Prymnesium_polylepis.1